MKDSENRLTIYRAELPAVHGYDLVGYGISPQEAVGECRKEYQKWARQVTGGSPNVITFAKAFEYHAGHVERCTTGTHHSQGQADYVCGNDLKELPT